MIQGTEETGGGVRYEGSEGNQSGLGFVDEETSGVANSVQGIEIQGEVGEGGHVNCSVIGVAEVPFRGALRDGERKGMLALKVLNKNLHSINEKERRQGASLADTSGEMDRSRDMAIDENPREGVGMERLDHSYKRRRETKLGKGGEKEVTAKSIVRLLKVNRKEQARKTKLILRSTISYV